MLTFVSHMPLPQYTHAALIIQNIANKLGPTLSAPFLPQGVVVDGRHVGQEHLWRSRVHALRLVLQVPVVLAGGDHMDYHTQGITQGAL